jgi:hypothetical protein
MATTEQKKKLKITVALHDELGMVPHQAVAFGNTSTEMAFFFQTRMLSDIVVIIDIV